MAGSTRLSRRADEARGAVRRRERDAGRHLVFDLGDPSDIPPIAEPLFQELDPTVESFRVMNAAQLAAGRTKASAP